MDDCHLIFIFLRAKKDKMKTSNVTSNNTFTINAQTDNSEIKNTSLISHCVHVNNITDEMKSNNDAIPSPEIREQSSIHYGKSIEKIGDFSLLQEKINNKSSFFLPEMDRVITSDVEATTRRGKIIELIKHGSLVEFPKPHYSDSCQATPHEYALITKGVNSTYIHDEQYHINKFKKHKWTVLENHGDLSQRKYYYSDMLIHQYEVISKAKNFYGHLPSVYKVESIIHKDTFSKMTDVDKMKELERAGKLNDFYLNETVIGRASKRLFDSLNLESTSTVIVIEKMPTQFKDWVQLNVFSILQPKK